MHLHSYISRSIAPATAAALVLALAWPHSAAAQAEPEVAAAPAAAPAATPEHRLGLTASVGGAGTIGAAYWLDSGSNLRFRVGLVLGVVPTGVAVSLEGGYRWYANRGPLRFFFEPAMELSASDVFSLALLGQIGAEYFFSDAFSVGFDTGLAFRMENSFQVFRFTTGATGLTASFYF